MGLAEEQSKNGVAGGRSGGKQQCEPEVPAECFCCGFFFFIKRLLSPYNLSKGNAAALKQRSYQ